MVVKPDGSTIETSEDLEKAYLPVEVRLDGSVIETSKEQEEKALSGTESSPAG